MALNDTPSPFRTPEQRKIDREAKRMAVLTAAVRMFNERGFHATSLDDVAASLGISKPTIYHYLGNKEQVLIACLRQALRELIEAAEQARARPGNSADRLRSFLVNYAEFNLRDFGRCVILTSDNQLSEDAAAAVRAEKRRIHDMMRAMIEEGCADGSIVCEDANLLAFTLAGALNWPARWYDDAAGAGPRETVAKMVDMLAAGFAPRQ